MILLSIEGGAGKNIAATGAVRKLAERGEVIDIITAWPFVWEGNPYVNKIYDYNRYEYLQDKLKMYDHVFFNDVYRESDFILKETNLSNIFNKVLNGVDEYVKPELYYNVAEEIEIAKLYETFKKPIFVVQTNGGVTNEWAWGRDYRLDEAIQLLNQFHDEYDIVHFRSKAQPVIEGVKHTADLTIRQAILLMKYSTKRLFIDSVHQHAAAAFDLPSVVLFNQSSSIRFSHPIHNVVQSEPPLLKNTNRIDSVFNGLDNDNARCPYTTNQIIFDKEKIIYSLNNNK